MKKVQQARQSCRSKVIPIPGANPVVAPSPVPTESATTPKNLTPESESERPHHPYSPSSLQYLEACPCFKSRQTTHVRTIAGTLGHKMVESGEDDEKLSDEDAIAAADCLDFIESRRRIYLAAAKTAWEKAGSVRADIPKFNIQEFKEIYLPIDDLKFDDCQSTTAGYVDETLVSWDETECDMIDWKFGFWAVEPVETNLQGIAYSLGAFKKFPKLQRVRFWFKQPHLESLDSHVFTRADIPALYLRVQAVVARSRKAREAGDFGAASPFVPVCNFCDRLGECPVGLNFALKVAKKFSPLQFPSDVTPSQILDPQNTLTALNLASVMKVWAEAFRRQVTDRVLRRDAPIPEGYGIQEMPGRRQIVDMGKFKDVALKHVTADEFEKCLDASFGPLEDIITEKAPRGTKKSMVLAFQTELEQFGAVKRGPSFSFLKVKSGKQACD